MKNVIKQFLVGNKNSLIYLITRNAYLKRLRATKMNYKRLTEIFFYGIQDEDELNRIAI